MEEEMVDERIVAFYYPTVVAVRDVSWYDRQHSAEAGCN
jgi:hypothetical protein